MKLSNALKTAGIYAQYIDHNDYIVAKNDFSDSVKLALLDNPLAEINKVDAVIGGVIVDVRIAITNCATRTRAENDARRVAQLAHQATTEDQSQKLWQAVYDWDLTTWDFKSIRFAVDHESATYHLSARLEPASTVNPNHIFVSGTVPAKYSQDIKNKLTQALRYKAQVETRAVEMSQARINAELIKLRNLSESGRIYTREGARFVKL